VVKKELLSRQIKLKLDHCKACLREMHTIPLNLCSIPELPSIADAEELAQFSGSLLIYSINLSQYDESHEEHKDCNAVEYQVRQLCELVNTGYFHDVVLCLTNFGKFLAKLRVIPLNKVGCFKDEPNLPEAAAQKKEDVMLEFLFSYCTKSLKASRIGKVALFSASIDKDRERLMQCLKKHLPMRLKEEHKKLLKLAAVAGALTAAGAIVGALEKLGDFNPAN
jgi:hypothetical protein